MRMTRHLAARAWSSGISLASRSCRTQRCARARLTIARLEDVDAAGRLAEGSPSGHDAGHCACSRRAERFRRPTPRAGAGHCEHATRDRAARVAWARRWDASRSNEGSFGAARLERCWADANGVTQELWRDARIEGLVVDEGFPLPIIPGAAIAALRPEFGAPRLRMSRGSRGPRRRAGYDELEDVAQPSSKRPAASGAVAFQVRDRVRRGSNRPPEFRR